jgi:RimJ/RimL family protein N-acetyltransferase
MQTNLFSGERVRLTAVRPEDSAVMARWYEDSEFGRMYDSGVAVPRSADSVRRWMDNSSGSAAAYSFAIRLLESDDLIGFLDIDGIQWNNGCAWMSLAIGDRTQRGKGYGYEAMTLALRFAFHELHLHRVQLTVFSYNERAIRLYERLGFQREGVYREYLQRDGQRYDMLLYGLLRREWEEKKRTGGIDR